MLSVSNVSLSKGRSYYEKENYYSKESAKEHSQWHGKLASELGLTGQVDFKTFDNLLFGLDKNGNSISTNSVDSKLYREAEITKKERGNLEFSISKICEKHPFKESEYKKINEIIKFHTRHNKKITAGSKKTCLSQINNIIKKTKLSPLQKEEAKETFKTILSSVTRPKERRAGYDLTFSAPKSVSVMGLVGKDNDLIKAHREAVFDVLNYIESKYANTRTGDNLKREIENTKKLLIAQFEHNTSRENDPQLHTHCVVLNLIQRMDGEWRSLHADDFRNHSKLFGTIYQNQLAKRVYELGYDISPDKDSTFKISNVPNELCEKFSKRRKQLIELGVKDQKSARDLVYQDRAKKSENISAEEQLKKWIKETKEVGTDLSKIKGDIRKTQEIGVIKINEMIQDAFSEASKMKMAFKYEEAFQIFAKYSQGKIDLTKSIAAFEQQVDQKLIKLQNGMYITKEALELEQKTILNLENQQSVKSILNLESGALDNLIKEKAAFSSEKKNEIINEVYAKTKYLSPEASLHISEIMKHFIHEDKRLTFQENENIKSYLSEALKELKISKSEKKELKANLNLLIDKATELTEGQKEAIKQTLSTTDKHIIWLGAAGAGKTFSLSTVVEQAKLAGYQVEGFAQNKKAADILANETKMEVNTIASLLLKESEQSQSQNEKIWIIDEAGMVGTKLGHDFVERAKSENARLIIVGDNRQLSSPTAGHFLKLTTNHTNLKRVELNKSMRQKDENLAKGVEILNSMLFDKLSKQNYKSTGKTLINEAMGYFKNSIKEFKTEEARVINLVKEYLSMSPSEREKTLIVARTHRSIAEITNQIRENLKHEGFLKNEINTQTFTAVDLSGSKGKYASNYEVGNIMIFDADNKIFFENKTLNVIKNEEYKIIQTDFMNNIVTIQDKNGTLFSLNPAKFKYDKPPKSKEFSIIPVYKKSEIKICENDKLAWSKNDWKTSRINKKEFKVLSIDQTNHKMEIIYQNGKTENIDLKSMNFLQHNWAVTYNAAQGDTKKNVLGIIDGISSIEDIYTVFTRPTHNLKVFVESEEKLKAAMEVSRSKKTAMELVNSQKEEYLITKSNKMDFYDKYQRVVSVDKDKLFLSFAAPSDISSLLFSHEHLKENILSAHNKAIDQTLNKFNQLIGNEYLYNSKTNEILFDQNNFSNIPYLHTNIEVTRLKNQMDKSINHYAFMENQGILKNIYQSHLAENLNNIGISCFNENGILRAQDRNDHIHSLFSEDFEKNIKALEEKFKAKGFDKFSSAYEIEKTSKQYIDNNIRKLNLDKISKENINSYEKQYQKLGHDEIIKNTIHSLSKDLQVFNEVKLFETLLNESKGHISTEEINVIHAQILTNPNLRMVDYDKFGKMVFAHNDLKHDEAKILMHSATRNEDKNYSLSFERVMRRAENKKFSQEQVAALAHCTIDQGNVKFLSGLNDKEAKNVFIETTNLYKNNGYKVLNVYAGNQSHTETILDGNRDLHLGFLLNKIADKKISLDNNTIIILKDIGNNITQNASILFDLAKENGSKVIFHANEVDFKSGENKVYLKNLKSLAGINLKQRYTGIQKQKEFYLKQEQNKKQSFTNSLSSEKFSTNKKEIPKEEIKKHHNIMNDIKSYYSNNLFLEQGKEALEYLTKRGFTHEQIKEFGFGLSFTKGIEDYANTKGYSKKDLISLSLVSEKTDGTSYDFYRNRIMIPIHDENGQCLGFGGRIYRKYEIDKQVSKYINPKNNLLFDKKSTLFGLDSAKEHIQSSGKVYVVEGYMDAIAMQKAGIKNVVAVMGTALTKENIDQLSKNSKEVILLFDNDKAGYNAAKLSYLQAVQSNLLLSYTKLSTEKDPDEFIRKYGNEAFKKEIESNKIPLEYFVNTQYKNENIKADYGQILQWRREILPSILNISDPIKRNLELKSASISLNQPITLMLEEKHYKYIPEAFLNPEEIEKRREYFNQVNKNKSQKIEFKPFDNTLKSKLQTKKIFHDNELNKGIHFEMKNKGLDFNNKSLKLDFINENKSLINNIKEIIELNEMMIHEKLSNTNSTKENNIKIYKFIEKEYKNASPQEISEKLMNEQLEKQKEQKHANEFINPYFHSEKLLNEIKAGAIKEEVELIHKQFNNQNILNFLAFKYASEKINNVTDLNTLNNYDNKVSTNDINIDNFKDYLQSYRLQKAVLYQEELKNHVRKTIQNDLEKDSDKSYKLNKLNMNEREFLINKVFPDQIDRNMSLKENVETVDKKFNEIMNNKENTLESFNKNLNELDKNKQELIRNKTIEISKFSLEKSMEQYHLKQNLKSFEETIHQDIHSKVKNKELSNNVFLEVRKTLIKESKFMNTEEINPEKAYLQMAKKENIPKYKDIIEDINISKIESRIEQENKLKNTKPLEYKQEPSNLKSEFLNKIQNEDSLQIKSEKERDFFVNSLAQKAGIKFQYPSNENTKNTIQRDTTFANVKMNNEFNNHFSNNTMAIRNDEQKSKGKVILKTQEKTKGQEISK
jgi:DNA primase catalytic core